MLTSPVVIPERTHLPSGSRSSCSDRSRGNVLLWHLEIGSCAKIDSENRNGSKQFSTPFYFILRPGFWKLLMKYNAGAQLFSFTCLRWSTKRFRRVTLHPITLHSYTSSWWPDKVVTDTMILGKMVWTKLYEQNFCNFFKDFNSINSNVYLSKKSQIIIMHTKET